MLDAHEQSVIVVGSKKAGKTALIVSATSEEKVFIDNYTATFGVEYAVRSRKFEGILIRQSIIEIGGEAGSVLEEHIYGEYAQQNNLNFIITFDLTDKNSFNQVSSYIEKIRKYNGSKINIYLVGTHADLSSEIKITEQEAIEFAKKKGLKNFFECSAKTHQNTEELFNDIAKIDLTFLKAISPIRYFKEFKHDPTSILNKIPIDSFDRHTENDLRLDYLLQNKQYILALILLLDSSQLTFSTEILQEVGKKFKDEIKNALFSYYQGRNPKSDNEVLNVYQNDALKQNTNLNVIFKTQRGFFGTSDTKGALGEISEKVKTLQNPEQTKIMERDLTK